jgi:hypothetical protein
MIFLAKSSFCLFHAGNKGNKFEENTREVFMREKIPEPKGPEELHGTKEDAPRVLGP